MKLLRMTAVAAGMLLGACIKPPASEPSGPPALPPPPAPEPADELPPPPPPAPDQPCDTPPTNSEGKRQYFECLQGMQNRGLQTDLLGACGAAHRDRMPAGKVEPCNVHLPAALLLVERRDEAASEMARVCRVGPAPDSTVPTGEVPVTRAAVSSCITVLADATHEGIDPSLLRRRFVDVTALFATACGQPLHEVRDAVRRTCRPALKGSTDAASTAAAVRALGSPASPAPEPPVAPPPAEPAGETALPAGALAAPNEANEAQP